VNRFLRNLRFYLFFLFRFRKAISMALSQAQLDTLQADLDALKSAVKADADADTAVAAANSALTTATASKALTAPAVAAAEGQLLNDANADFNPPAGQ